MNIDRIPQITLNDDITIPQLGFGVFKVDPGETERVVSAALEAGYRHIDTARIYDNEAGVGRAIAASGIPREELFITTKLWNDDQPTAAAHAAIDLSLSKLGLDYVDLYLIHWPAPQRGTFVEAWLAMDEIARAGKARSVGVSNFMPEHLEALTAVSDRAPSVNQIELHPAFQQKETLAYTDAHGIRVEAWGPLGQGKYNLATLPGWVELAEKHGRSVQQIAIRWHLQCGRIVIPKTTHKERMLENLDVFDFELTDEDLAAITLTDTNMRVGAHPLEANW